MNGPRAVQPLALTTSGEVPERDVVGHGMDPLPLKPEDRPSAAPSSQWAIALIADLSERVARLVRRPSPPDPSMRTMFEEATLGLESLHDELDTSLPELDAANWEELERQLDRVNDLLRSLVEDIAERRAPPTAPG